MGCEVGYLADVIEVDTTIYRTLVGILDVVEGKKVDYMGSSIDALGLTFVSPGLDGYALVEGGEDLLVDISNAKAYVDSMVDNMVGSGIEPVLKAMQEGFTYTAMDRKAMQQLLVEDLNQVLNGVEGREEDWMEAALLHQIVWAHGYDKTSITAKLFCTLLHQYTPEERREFLMFITGSPRLPLGGFAALHPPLTVVCKDSKVPEEVLPSVMTCANYIKLPAYTTLAILQDRMHTAVAEGSLEFSLS